MNKSQIVESLYNQQKKSEALKKEAKEIDAEVHKNLSELFQKPMNIAYGLKGDIFGIVHMETEHSGFELDADTPKKVIWDQSELLSIGQKLQEKGIDPGTFIKVEMKVSEETYKNLTGEMKALFDNARTVKPEKIKFILKKKDDSNV